MIITYKLQEIEHPEDLYSTEFLIYRHFIFDGYEDM